MNAGEIDYDGKDLYYISDGEVRAKTSGNDIEEDLVAIRGEHASVALDIISQFLIGSQRVGIVTNEQDTNSSKDKIFIIIFNTQLEVGYRILGTGDDELESLGNISMN